MVFSLDLDQCGHNVHNVRQSPLGLCVSPHPHQHSHQLREVARLELISRGLTIQHVVLDALDTTSLEKPAEHIALEW